MNPKNRREFLAMLHGDEFGYKGPDDLDAVKKFLADEGHTLVDETDNPIDVDLIWATLPGRKIQVSPTPARAPVVNKAAVADAKIAGSVSGARIGDHISSAKKAYDAKAKQGKTVFPDADMAEGCGAFLRAANAIVNGKVYSQLDNDLSICEKAASSVNPATGGVLVPDEYRSFLIYLTENYGVARRMCMVMPMASDTLTLPRLTGRFTFAFSGENTAATDSELPTDAVQLVAKKVIGLAKIPNELMDDSAISVADMYAKGFAEGLAYTEDNCFVNGDGTSTYGGIRGLADRATNTAAIGSSHSSWSTLDETDIVTTLSQAENIRDNNVSILCSRQFFWQVLKRIATGSGRGGINEFLTVRGTGGPADAQWYGYPVYFSQVMPTATASGQKCMYAGDFSAGAMFGDRKSLTITSSGDRYFDADQVALRAIARFDINIHGDGRGSTYGPIVGLITD